MVRNLKMVNEVPSFPTRVCRKITGRPGRHANRGGDERHVPAARDQEERRGQEMSKRAFAATPPAARLVVQDLEQRDVVQSADARAARSGSRTGDGTT
jgi:hypothetical protein